MNILIMIVDSILKFIMILILGLQRFREFEDILGVEWYKTGAQLSRGARARVFVNFLHAWCACGASAGLKGPRPDLTMSFMA
jgi:hypothetical protein